MYQINLRKFLILVKNLTLYSNSNIKLVEQRYVTDITTCSLFFSKLEIINLLKKVYVLRVYFQSSYYVVLTAEIELLAITFTRQSAVKI